MRQRIAGLDVRFVGEPSDSKPTVILLHGFGAPGDDLVGLAREVDAPEGTCFVFPTAPVDLSGHFGGGARAWWMIDVERLMRDPRQDRSDEVPQGMAEARAQMIDVVREIAARGGSIVLGGFSQGAMLSCDVALHSDLPLAGLVLMSGTLLARREWEPRLATRHGLRVLQSHGREDPLLAYAAAERLRDFLRVGGLAVDWVPFSGGHGIAPVVLDRLGAFLGDLAAPA